ncbi:MAG TPA: hypothetical protein VFA49_14270, partial [Chloroflexota bacterium]|nr:hypothetical protein [Chloroflexota bacterium]
MVRHASPAAPAAVWAAGGGWPRVVPRAVRRLALALAWLGRAVEVPRIAYPALLVLQVEVAWGDWRGRDLTPGDTADAFVLAFGWFNDLTVNIVRSPLYTAFYGSLLHLTSDVPAITALHRWLIVLTADLLLLALLRRLVAASIAWLVAAWWTLLLSTYGVTYEVHLFGALPLLLAAFLATRDRWQGAALAVLFGGALLVRNELMVPWALFGLACLFAASRGRGAVVSRDAALEHGAPLAAVVLATCFFFS